MHQKINQVLWRIFEVLAVCKTWNKIIIFVSFESQTVFDFFLSYEIGDRQTEQLIERIQLFPK